MFFDRLEMGRPATVSGTTTRQRTPPIEHVAAIGSSQTSGVRSARPNVNGLSSSSIIVRTLTAVRS